MQFKSRFIDKKFLFECMNGFLHFIHHFFLLEPPTSKWALALFDWDGCTACVETKCLGNHHLKVGSQADLSYDGEIHLVKILALEGNYSSSTYLKIVKVARDSFN